MNLAGFFRWSPTFPLTLSLLLCAALLSAGCATSQPPSPSAAARPSRSMAILTPPLPPRPLYLEWDHPSAAADAGWAYEVWSRRSLAVAPVLLAAFSFADSNFWFARTQDLLTYRVPIPAGSPAGFFTLSWTNAQLGLRLPPNH